MAQKVKKSDMVTVYGTGGKLKAGKAYKVHALVADKLLKSSAASKSKPAPGKGEKGGEKDA